MFSGTNTSSITISPVIEARSLTLPWMAGGETFQPFEHEAADPAVVKSLAHTTNTSAIGLLVIHILLPDRL